MSMLTEAERCLKCKKPQCSAHCPVGTPIPEVMKLFIDGNIQEAGRVLFENNPLSAITSMVCPHSRNCNGNCIMGRNGEPIEFYQIEQYISNLYLDTVTLTPPPSNGIRVGVIGAGPAGMAMCIRLALKGFKVTLIEAREHIGGVLRFGIPDFRLPNSIVDKYMRIFRQLGIKFKPNTFIGTSMTIDDMFLDGYKAIFISVGTSKPRRLGLLGETLGNVYYAVDFLRTPLSYDLGKNIVVIGAGNVAMDAARMAVRVAPGSNVTCINNRRECDMTCTHHELEMARIDGVKFAHELSTIHLREDNVLCVKVKPVVNEDGSVTYEEQMDDRVELPADSIIIAIGQGPQDITKYAHVVRNDRGLVDANENGETNRPGVFAAGDIVTGPRTVVEAVAFTNKVADKMIEYCMNNK